MNKLLSFFIILISMIGCITLTSCQYLKWPKTEPLPDSYEKKTIEEELSPFSKVVISAPVDVDVHFVTGKNYFMLQGDSNLIEETPYYVKDDTFYLLSNPQYIYAPDNKMMLTLYVPMLTEFDYHGPGKVNLPNIQTSHFIVNAEGGAFIYMTGKTYRLDLTATGTSRINAKCVKAHIIFVNTADLAQAEVSNRGNVSALSSNHSDIYYYDRPEMVAGHTPLSGSVMRMEGILPPYSVPYQIHPNTSSEPYPVQTTMAPTN